MIKEPVLYPYVTYYVCSRSFGYSKNDGTVRPMLRLPSPCLPFTIFPCFYLPASLSAFYLLSTLTFQLVLEFEQTHRIFYQMFLIRLNYGNLIEFDISTVVVLQNLKKRTKGKSYFLNFNNKSEGAKKYG